MKYVKELYRNVRLNVLLWIGGIKMRTAIRAAINAHKKINKYTSNQRRCRQFVVLLNIPVKRGNKVRMREQLYWCSIKTFKKIREKGWLPHDMIVPDLNQKSFYVTNMNRTYMIETAERAHAIEKYQLYLKSKL